MTSVNSNMVMAYWLIGRESVRELQGGEKRAEYGRQIITNLSKQLNEKYGKGFSVANIKNFRQFYQSYPNRLNSISYPEGSQCEALQKSYPAGSQSVAIEIPSPTGREPEKLHQVGEERKLLGDGE